MRSIEDLLIKKDGGRGQLNKLNRSESAGPNVNHPFNLKQLDGLIVGKVIEPGIKQNNEALERHSCNSHAFGRTGLCHGNFQASQPH